MWLRGYRADNRHGDSSPIHRREQRGNRPVEVSVDVSLFLENRDGCFCQIIGECMGMEIDYSHQEKYSDEKPTDLQPKSRDRRRIAIEYLLTFVFSLNTISARCR